MASFVHAGATVWCLLDEAGTQLGTGRTKTSSLALRELASELGKDGDLVVGQEVGTHIYLVHDAIRAAGVPVAVVQRGTPTDHRRVAQEDRPA